MGWLRKRLGEGSTHAALGVIGLAIDQYLTGGSAAAIAAIVPALIAFAIKDKGAGDAKK